MQELIQFVGNVGFPIVMVAYLMTRFEKTLEKTTNAIDSLEEVIKDHVFATKRKMEEEK